MFQEFRLALRTPGNEVCDSIQNKSRDLSDGKLDKINQPHFRAIRLLNKQCVFLCNIRTRTVHFPLSIYIFSDIVTKRIKKSVI